MPKSFLVKRKCCHEGSVTLEIKENAVHEILAKETREQSGQASPRVQETPVITYGHSITQQQPPEKVAKVEGELPNFSRTPHSKVYEEELCAGAEQRWMLQSFLSSRLACLTNELRRIPMFQRMSSSSSSLYDSFSSSSSLFDFPRSPSSSIESPLSPASCSSVDVPRDEIESSVFQRRRGSSFSPSLDHYSSHSEDESPWGLSPCPSPVIPYQNVQQLSRTEPFTDDLRPVAKPKHTCKDCGKSFMRASSLSNHKLIHKNIKAFHCADCGMSFLRKSDLGKHTVTHTGMKPYQCDICYKCFSQSSNMLTHRRRHTGTRPYSCRQCGKSFYRKVDVRRHSKIHE